LAVRIITLGQVRVVVDGREKPALPQQRLRFALLVYLAVEGDAARESLLAMFWPDRDASKARHILSQNIYELRRALGDEAVVAEGDRLRIGDDVVVDACEFTAKMAAGDGADALALHGGPFLEGFFFGRARVTLQAEIDRAQRNLPINYLAGISPNRMGLLAQVGLAY
jgi:DNA-binding SARP family transcriptional activator